ncbi:MAG TPA: hypothetical protein VJ726_00515 [Candidatus Limnocylindria bacterium]|nr:hypothetical protein [Candidatus Limnocylindria bacterium]
MTRGQAAVLRFVLICAAWSVGQTLTWGLALGTIGVVIPAALALGVLVLTEDLGRPRAASGDLKYWRGRRVNDDERRGRWN